MKLSSFCVTLNTVSLNGLFISLLFEKSLRTAIYNFARTRMLLAKFTIKTCAKTCERFSVIWRFVKELKHLVFVSTSIFCPTNLRVSYYKTYVKTYTHVYCLTDVFSVFAIPLQYVVAVNREKDAGRCAYAYEPGRSRSNPVPVTEPFDFLFI